MPVIGQSQTAILPFLPLLLSTSQPPWNSPSAITTGEMMMWNRREHCPPLDTAPLPPLYIEQNEFPPPPRRQNEYPPPPIPHFQDNEFPPPPRVVDTHVYHSSHYQDLDSSVDYPPPTK